MVKIERTFPAPASLETESKKVSGSYSEPDVVEQLRTDFHDKCYICEMKELQDPEELIDFRLKGNTIEVKAKSCEDTKSVLTAELVWEVFNIENTGMRIFKSHMRLQKLNQEMNILYDNLEEIKKRPDSRIVLRKLKALLRRESEFAAFKRGYVRENIEKFPQLMQYIV